MNPILTESPPPRSDRQTVVPFVDLALQHRLLGAELDAAWAQVRDASEFILGRSVAVFENEFAEFLGARYAVGVGNGLDALKLSLRALEIGRGDEVIVPAHTFIATALAVAECGATPVFVDCDPRTGNLDPERIEGAISARTRGILPVHFAGLPAAMRPILDVAAKHGLEVVEDACQAHGARYGDASCGTLGAAGCFSFYPSKNLGALGDGGMIVTNRADVAERLRRLRNYGQQAKNVHELSGVNSRLDSIQAEFLRVKLRRLAAWNDARRRHAARYRELLAGVGDLLLPCEIAPCETSPSDSGQSEARRGDTQVYHLFVVETAERDGLRSFLAERGVEAGVHYPTPMHLQPAFAGLGYRRGAFPAAERFAERCLSLPMFPELEDRQIEHVAVSIRTWFERERDGR